MTDWEETLPADDAGELRTRAIGTPQELWRELAAYTRTTRGDTDYEVVLSYLQAMAHNTPPCSANTIANYRTVLLRFLKWYAAYRYGRGLHEFAYEDVLAYQEFMRDPPADWIGPKRVKDPADKRPFTQALSESEVERNAAIISRLFAYLQRQGRIWKNPWRTDAPKGRQPTTPVKQERHLTTAMWEALWATVHRVEVEAPTSDRPQAIARAARQRWALTALYLAALRPDECAQSRAGQLVSDRTGWWFDMPATITKGRKAERIPVAQLFVDELARYRALYGIAPAIPRSGDDWPLILTLRGDHGVTRRTLYDLVAEIMRSAADTLVDDDPDAAGILRIASPHWLRHSRATHLLEGGVARKIVMAIMRHSKDSTLDQYIHAEDQAKQDGAQIILEGLISPVALVE